ncbi:MAG: acyl-CoA carboxylase subunit epsilon [Chloroflexota bacterium]|nr:acyl-CoA carboxylase subunit epsilon [Chloroflexota bacterium]
MTDTEPQPPGATDPEQDSREDEHRPFLRVVKGDATPEEVAALVAVVAALGSAGAEPPQRRVPEWSAHHRTVRRTLPHGPGGWRSSGLPG